MSDAGIGPISPNDWIITGGSSPSGRFLEWDDESEIEEAEEDNDAISNA